MKDYITTEERMRLNAECICLSRYNIKKSRWTKLKEALCFAFWSGMLIMLFVNMFLEITNYGT